MTDPNAIICQNCGGELYPGDLVCCEGRPTETLAKHQPTEQETPA